MLSKVDRLKKLQKLLVVEFRMSKVGRHDHQRNMRKWLSLEEALKRFPNISTTWKIQRIQQVCCAIPVISPRRKHQIQSFAFKVFGRRTVVVSWTRQPTAANLKQTSWLDTKVKKMELRNFWVLGIPLQSIHSSSKKVRPLVQHKFITFFGIFCWIRSNAFK